MIGIGNILDDRYKIIEPIGKGGMGRVFLAQNIKLGNEWAIEEISYTANKGVNLHAEPEMLEKLSQKSLPRIVINISTKKTNSLYSSISFDKEKGWRFQCER